MLFHACGIWIYLLIRLSLSLGMISYSDPGILISLRTKNPQPFIGRAALLKCNTAIQVRFQKASQYNIHKT